MNERRIERLFYHDLLNLASSLRGITEVIQDVDDKSRSEMLSLLGTIAESIIETIHARRQYRSMATHELTLKPSDVDCVKLLKRASTIFKQHTLSQNKRIEIRLLEQLPQAAPIVLFTDKDVLQAALGYGIRSALELIQPGNEITLGLSTVELPRSQEIQFSISFPGSLSEVENEAFFKEPEVDAPTLKTFPAYVFYTLVTTYLSGHAACTIQDASIVLTARFVHPCLSR